MSTATITGTVAHNISPLGPSASLVLGSPLVGPTSTTGPQLTFEEVAGGTYKVGATLTQVISFGTVADGDLVYIGTSTACTFKLNGGSEVFNLAAGGFFMCYLGSITGVSVTAGVVDSIVQVLILGST